MYSPFQVLTAMTEQALTSHCSNEEAGIGLGVLEMQLVETVKCAVREWERHTVSKSEYEEKSVKSLTVFKLLIC